MQPVILMYHRIASCALNPWGLAVEPERFERQLNVLRDRRRPLPMREFLHGLERGTLPGDAVGVTFDDGYADNLWHAKPRLESVGVPATLFVATGKVGTGAEFWWDEVARLILRYPRVLDCDVAIGGCSIRLLFTDPLLGNALPCWDDWRHPRTERETKYLEVWARLRPLTDSERDLAMSNLRAVLGHGPADPENLPMTADELQEFAASPLIEIGAHTVSHPMLSILDPEESRNEIGVSKRDCEEIVGCSPIGFAYPYGDFNDAVRAMVQEAGFLYACSTKSEPLRTDCYDRFALPRLQVMNWGVEEFERALIYAGTLV